MSLNRIKLSNVAQNPELQAVAAAFANNMVAESQNSNMFIKKENFVEKISSTPSSPTTQKR